MKVCTNRKHRTTLNEKIKINSQVGVDIFNKIGFNMNYDYNRGRFKFTGYLLDKEQSKVNTRHNSGGEQLEDA